MAVGISKEFYNDFIKECNNKCNISIKRLHEYSNNAYLIYKVLCNYKTDLNELGIHLKDPRYEYCSIDLSKIHKTHPLYKLLFKYQAYIWIYPNAAYKIYSKYDIYRHICEEAYITLMTYINQDGIISLLNGQPHSMGSYLGRFIIYNVKLKQKIVDRASTLQLKKQLEEIGSNDPYVVYKQEGDEYFKLQWNRSNSEHAKKYTFKARGSKHSATELSNRTEDELLNDKGLGLFNRLYALIGSITNYKEKFKKYGY